MACNKGSERCNKAGRLRNLSFAVGAFGQILQLPLQFLYLLTHPREAAPERVAALLLFERLDGRAPPDAGADDLARQHAGLRADDRARLHARVVAEADLPAD